MDTNTSVLAQIAAAFSGHHWLPLIAVVSLYVRKIASPASKFPGMPNISPEWLSSISALGGLVYGLDLSLQAGDPASLAVLNCVGAAAASGFADGLLTAIFAHNAAPNWARFLVGIFDDVGGSGGMPKPVPVTPSVAAAAAFGVRKDSVQPGPTVAKRGRWRRGGQTGRAIFCVSVAAGLVACFGPGAVVPTENLVSCVATDALESKPVAQIAIDCGSDVLTVIAALLASDDPRVQASGAFLEARRTKLALSSADAGAP